MKRALPRGSTHVDSTRSNFLQEQETNPRGKSWCNCFIISRGLSLGKMHNWASWGWSIGYKRHDHATQTTKMLSQNGWPIGTFEFINEGLQPDVELWWTWTRLLGATGALTFLMVVCFVQLYVFHFLFVLLHSMSLEEWAMTPNCNLSKIVHYSRHAASRMKGIDLLRSQWMTWC